MRPVGSVLHLWAWLLLAVLPACAPTPPALPAPVLAPEPAPQEIERVLFLLGDPGEATTGTSPVLQHLQHEIEAWSARLAADSAVALVILGDIVYPLGLHPAGSRWFDHDTAIVMSQVRLVAGPNAVARGARALFVAGNHDWGERDDFEGVVRLNNLDTFLQAVRVQTGADVNLVPQAGSGGPWVWDWGPHVRLLLLDTAWWLLSAEEPEKALFLEQIEEAMRTAGEREVVFASHHPFRSVGSHGGTYSFWKMLGIGYVLRRSGAFLQSLNSRPYREMEAGLREIFARTGPPFAFVGGHDHSLQVLGRVEPTDPRYSIVSGSGSKLTGVRGGRGVRFARSAPGYMRLLILRDGTMHLSVVAAPERYQLCPDGTAGGECMLEGIAAFQTVHSQPLR